MEKINQKTSAPGAGTEGKISQKVKGFYLHSGMPQKHSGNKYRELVFQFQAGAHIFFLAHRFELHGGRFGGAPIGLEAPDHVDAVLGEQLGGHVDDRAVAQSEFEFSVGLAPQGAVFFLRHAFRPTSYDGFGSRSHGIGSTFHLRRGFRFLSFESRPGTRAAGGCPCRRGC